MTKARDIASAAPAPSTVSATELGYLDGVTSAVQTQLDAKTAKSTLTTTGDIYYASSANTPARLGIGSTGNVLTVAGGVPSWAAPAGGGGMTSLASGSLSGASLDLQSISGSYKHLQLVLRNSRTANSTEIKYRFNNLSTNIYQFFRNVNQNGTYLTAANNSVDFGIAVYNAQNASAGANALILNIYDYANTSANKQFDSNYTYQNNSSQVENTTTIGACRTTDAIDRITVFPDSGNWNAGTYELFGVK